MPAPQRITELRITASMFVTSCQSDDESLKSASITRLPVENRWSNQVPSFGDFRRGHPVLNSKNAF